MKDRSLRLFTGWTASELWRQLYELNMGKAPQARAISHRVYAWSPCTMDRNAPNGRPEWNQECLDEHGDEECGIVLPDNCWELIDKWQTLGFIEWNGRPGDDPSTDPTGRIFDWIGLGEFQNELHWEGLPVLEEVQAKLTEQGRRTDLIPHESWREGFTEEGWGHITDADRNEIWRISEKIIDSGGGIWIDNGEKVSEGQGPEFGSPDDPEYQPGARHYHTGIRVTLTNEEWAFIDALPLGTAQDWDKGTIGAPDEFPWNDPEGYWTWLTEQADKAKAQRAQQA